MERVFAFSWYTASYAGGLLSGLKGTVSCRCVGDAQKKSYYRPRRRAKKVRASSRGAGVLRWIGGYECKLKELEMSAIRRDMAVERQPCTKEAYEVMVGLFLWV